MFDFLRKWKLRPGNKPESVVSLVDFRALAENSLDLIIRCDLDQIASYASPSVMRLLGIEPEELIGKSHMSFVLPEDRPLIEEVVAEHVDGKHEAFATFRMVKKDGSIIWVEGAGRMVEDAVSGAAEFIVTMRDITQRKTLEATLAMLALTDGLTGLANRRAFDDALDSEWQRTVRCGAMLSLLLLDVDCFKAFNDQYGHQTGDQCLRAVSSAIAQAIGRPTDLAARYGGEEFAVLLPDTDAAGAMSVAQKVLGAVGDLNIPHEGTMANARYVTVSIGCATALSRTGVSAQMPAGLLEAADRALYKAKDGGRNRVEAALLLTNQQAG